MTEDYIDASLYPFHTKNVNALPEKSRVIDAISLAFAHSSMRDLVGRDALRTVLSAEYPALTSGQVLRLQHIWDLLESQPGFAPDDAGPAFFRIAGWTRELGLPVELPTQLSEVPNDKRNRLASQCAVPEVSYGQLFLGRSKIFDQETSYVGSSPQRKESKSIRTPFIVVAIVVALGCATSLYLSMTERSKFAQDTDHLLELFSTIIPSRDIAIKDNVLSATVISTSFLQAPEPTRKSALEAAALMVAPAGIQSIVLLDESGKVHIRTDVISAQGSDNLPSFTTQMP